MLTPRRALPIAVRNITLVPRSTLVVLRSVESPVAAFANQKLALVRDASIDEVTALGDIAQECAKPRHTGPIDAVMDKNERRFAGCRELAVLDRAIREKDKRATLGRARCDLVQSVDK